MNSSGKQKILIVHNYYQIPGGEDTVVANEKKMLEEHGHEVILYSRNNSELNEMSKLQKLLLPITTVFNPRTYREVKKLIKEEQIDIVHVHNTLNLISPSVYYTALKCKVPVIQTMHNFRLLCPGGTFYRDGHICEDCVEHGLFCAVKHSCYRDSKLQTLACVISTKIHRMTGIYGKLNYICLTDFNKEKLLMLKQIKPERVFVKPNFTFENTEKSCGGGYNGYYIFIGRVEKIKGIDVILDAFANLPELQLKIAGTGTDLDQYKDKASKNIEFLGFLNREQLSRWLSSAKAVIVASQWYETFGMVIVEAYAARKPVIVGNLGNTAALVDEGITGLHFGYDSSDVLREAVLRFEKLDVAALGKNGYRKFKTEFTEDRNYSALKSIYDSVIVR